VTEQILLYGIHNCDTVKKARKWLDAQNLDHQFVDFRKDGTDKLKIKHWIDTVGADTLLNKRGTTWRKLSPEQQQLDSDQALVSLLCEYPALIKRPVLEAGKKLLVGFSEATYLDIK
jgi:arsenate reductase (glutaredoxin)